MRFIPKILEKLQKSKVLKNIYKKILFDGLILWDFKLYWCHFIHILRHTALIWALPPVPYDGTYEEWGTNIMKSLSSLGRIFPPECSRSADNFVFGFLVRELFFFQFKMTRKAKNIARAILFSRMRTFIFRKFWVNSNFHKPELTFF